MQKVSQTTKELTRQPKSRLKHQKKYHQNRQFHKNRRIGQFACELANPAKLANSVVRYMLIGQFGELANSVLQSHHSTVSPVQL